MEFYLKGNEYYRIGNFDEAIKQFSEGICYLDISSDLFLKLLLNRAQAYKMTRQFENVVVDCSKVISIERSFKALVRRLRYKYLYM